MVYLKELESKLLSEASDKELMLYRFLKGQKHTLKQKDNDLQTSVCVNAFVTGQGQEELKNLRKIKPFKGLHYTNNLEMLVAASLIEIDSELANIETFLRKRSPKECFLINSALKKDFCIVKEPTNEIEKLACKLIRNEAVEIKNIQYSINVVSDLYDYFILETAITKFNLDLSFENKRQEYEEFYVFGNAAITRIEKVFLVAFYGVLLFGSILVAPIIAKPIMANWDMLEPIAYMTDKIVMFALAFTGFFLTRHIGSIRGFVNLIIKCLVLKLLGINNERYKKVVERIQSE